MKKFNFKWLLLSIILSIASINTAWGTSRKFKTGERIYFEDAAVIGGACMKYSGNNLWAVFVGAGGNSDWVAASKQSGNWDAAGALYYFDVPQFSSADYEFTAVIFTRNDWGIQTYNQSPDEYYNYFKLTSYDGNKHVSGEWKKYSVNPMLIGSMNDWNPDASDYKFGDYDGSVCRLIVDLPADETYEFQILHGTGWYSYDASKAGWTITNTTHESWQTLYAGNDNAQITTGEAGTYIFRYNDSDHSFAAYYPQSRLAKQTILYFDVADNTSWNNKTYTSKWYFKYWDSGNDYDSDHPETCSSPVESYKYYVTIPNNDWLGRVQVDRYDGASRQGGSDVAMAYNRSASTQNCVKAASGTSTSVTWTTYCPPTTSETFADNSTTKISWQPNTNDGSTSGKAIWVKTGTTLKVTASASKAVADGNMTVKYDFNVNSGSTTTNTTGSYSSTASTNNTQYAVNVKTYTNYNLDNTASSTKHTHTIYYKALNTYSVTHTLSGVTKASGRDGTDAAAYYVAYDATYTANTGYYLPENITVTIGGATKTQGTDYTWTVTDGTSGALSILSSKIDGNVVVTINGEWRWSVAGSWEIITPGEGDPYWDPDTYAMGNITQVSSDYVCSVEVTLDANTNYTFKVVDRAADPYDYWGNSTTATYYMTYGNSGESTDWGFDKDYSYACGITTAGAGTYTFTYNISDSKMVVTYPTSYYVTAAGNPAAGGTVTPSSATYMSTSVGGEITATPNYSHYFNGWTSNAGGTFTSASSATTTFKPASAAATVTAAFAERTAFIEGNFQVYNSSRATRTKTGDSWQDASTNIKMTYDSENNRYYLHTYSTPAELAEQLNSADAYFYIKTSTSSSSVANAVAYKAYSSSYQSLTAYGSSNKKTTGTSEHSFKFTGSEDGYVIIYFDGSYVWYELECALSYYGGDGATGDAPAARTFYPYNSTQTAASNTYSKAGYVFTHWDTASDDGGTDYDPSDDVTMNAHEICLHAMWIVKYAMYGSLDSDASDGAGMSGWSVADNFTYSAGTYTLVLNLTKPNEVYKFRVLDHDGNVSYGLAVKAVIPENTATALNSTAADAQLATAGRGNYTFTVVEYGGYPKITITNPTSYLITLGVKSVNDDDSDAGDLGGTVTARDAAGNTYASGSYIASEETVTVEATDIPTGYHFVGWWNSSAYSSSAFSTDNPTSWTVDGAVNAYVKFIEDTNTFSATSSNNWSTVANWSAGAVPAITDVVYITAPVEVNIAHATAKSIVLNQNGKTGKLTIQPNMGLEVAGTITRTTNGSNSLATRPEDLILQSSLAGNASLVFTNSNECQATVQMYSIGDIDGGTWNWQFMGIPFTSANALYSYYDAYLYEWKSSGWDVVPNGNSMTPFTGYCITQNDPTTYVMEGTLNPNSDVEITIPANKEFVMANSWSAPISVCNFTETTLPLANKTIYLFNTGHAESAASAGVAAGTYIAMPINSAAYTGNYLIAPMEGFYVDNTSGSEATITLKYDELVRPSGSHTDIVAGPMHAPKRMAAEADPAVMKIKATGSRYSDRVVILAREDFSTGFDNGWDGKNINEPGVAPIIYALRADGTKDAVSAIPTYEGTVVGFRQGEDNQYTFSFEYDGDEILYLNDLKQRAATLIDAEHTYTFTSAAGDAEARFTISATPIEKMPTGVDEIESGINVHKQMINGTLYIIRDGRIYNAEGALVK